MIFYPKILYMVWWICKRKCLLKKKKEQVSGTHGTYLAHFINIFAAKFIIHFSQRSAINSLEILNMQIPMKTPVLKSQLNQSTFDLCLISWFFFKPQTLCLREYLFFYWSCFFVAESATSWNGQRHVAVTCVNSGG